MVFNFPSYESRSGGVDQECAGLSGVLEYRISVYRADKRKGCTVPVEIPPDRMIFFFNKGINFSRFCQFIGSAYVSSPQTGKTIACVETQKINPIFPFQDITLEHPLVSADFEPTDFGFFFGTIEFERNQVLLPLRIRNDRDFCYRFFPAESIISLKKEPGAEYGAGYRCPEENE